MKPILLIDDMRNFITNPDAPVFIARTSAEALEVLIAESKEFQSIWLDHDLGCDDTINPVVDYLCEQSFLGTPIDVEVVYVHTSNPVGAYQMMSTLVRYGYEARRVPASEFFVV
jgi:hypothetical protein